MAPMIDVVFQLLIFFMLTLRIVAPEGDFNINMPIGTAASHSDQLPPLDVKVRLVANPDGSLQQLQFGGRELGNDFPACFERLNQEIAVIAGRGKQAVDDVVVEIDSDYGLHYKYVLRAVSACAGRFDPQTGGRVTYVENIKLTPPHRPE